jgi:4-amino-4-deoxy-L-arabinose transferase-like glycosyltransferase
LVRSRLAAVPVWVWLAAIVVGSAALRAVLAGGIVAPFVMVDEVIWAELARGIADSGEPLLRGEPDPGYSVLYPLVISPVYALFENLPEAYAAVKVVNAALMSLAAVPAYLLARRVMSRTQALLAAVLAVALPSLAYTGTVMTENLFYLLFLVVAFALVLVLEQPSWRRVALLVALLGLAFATRVQALAIVPAALLAPLVLAIFDRRGLRETLARYRVLYSAVVGLAALVLATQLAAGRSPDDILGAYSTVADENYDVGEVLRYLVWHVAELALYLLVIPIAATIVLVGRARSLDPPLRIFLAVLIGLTACLVPVVAAFASAFPDRIEERNLFYLAPLFVIGLFAWIERDAPRPRVLAPIAAAVSALLVLAIPFDRFLTTSAITDTLMLLPFWSLQDRIGSDWIRPTAFALALALAVLFLFVPRRYAIVLPLVVLGLWAVAFKPIWWGKHGFERFSRASLFQGIRTAERDWIDKALPAGAEAAFIWTGRTDRLTVYENEFFNRAVGPVYYTGEPTPGGLPETRITIHPRTGVVRLPDGSPVEDPYVVADSSFEPDGAALARDRGWGITLWRVKPPLVSAVRIDGLYANDSWSGRTVTYVRRRCQPGRLAVGLSSDAHLFLEPQIVVARSEGRVVSRLRLPPGAGRSMRIRMRPDSPGGDCRVVFTVTPTAVPSEVTAGANPDPRELGAHFNRFVYTPDT